MTRSKWASIGLVFFCFVAEARKVGNYQVTFSPSGRRHWINHDTGDWDCKSVQGVNYDWASRDHHGKVAPVPQNRESLAPSLFDEPEVRGMVQRDLDSPYPQFKVYIGEECRHEYSTYEPVGPPDSNGSPTYMWVSHTEYANVTWNCNVLRPPAKIGAEVQLGCVVQDSSGPVASLEKLAAAGYTAKVSLSEKSEKPDIDLCNGSNQNRTIIQLRQGVGGHFGENDFVFKVEIDGKKTVEVKSEDGLLNEDIAYCGGGKDIKVKVTAVEKDLFWSDKYRPLHGDGTLTLARQAGGAPTTAKLDLWRRATWFSNPNHQISVTVYDASAPGTAPAPTAQPRQVAVARGNTH